MLADEIHAPLTLPGAVHVPFVTVSPAAAARGVSLISASKTFILAGLGCAQIVMAGAPPRSAVDRLPLAARHCGHLGVIAAEAAYSRGDAWLDAVIAVLDSNRSLLAELLADRLPEAAYAAPRAGYLAWLDLTGLELGADPPPPILERGRLALSPGPQSEGAERDSSASTSDPRGVEEAVGRSPRARVLSRLALRGGQDCSHGQRSGARRSLGARGGRRRRALAPCGRRSAPRSDTALSTPSHIGSATPTIPAIGAGVLPPRAARARGSLSNARADGYPPANDAVLAALRWRPDRLVAFCRIDPRAGASPKHVAASTPAPAASSSTAGRRLRARRARVERLSSRRRAPRSPPDPCRAGIPRWRAAVQLASRYPDARLILAHAAVSDLGWLQHEMPRHPNCSSNLLVEPRDMMALFRRPLRHVLWASDSPTAAAGAAALHMRFAIQAGVGGEGLRSIAGEHWSGS